MARFTASAARRNLFHLLDSAEKGEEVVLERKGVRFRLIVEDSPPGEVPPSPLIIDDPDVLNGNWTWQADENGVLVFHARPA